MIVEDLLKQKDIFYISKGKDFIIRCLNPEHEDKNPSCRLDKVTGIFHCFSCSYRGNIFTVFNIQRDRFSEKVYNLMKKIQEIKLNSKGIEIPEGSIPFNRDYRNISSLTYEKFEAFTNDKEFPDRLVFPIRDITGRIVVLQGRHMYKSGKDKYYNYPEQVALPLFPFSVEPINGSIILVEGLFDMLNLHDKGLTNAVCIFGVSTLSKPDIVYIKLKNYIYQGVQKAYVMLDGDEAGKRASKQITELIKSVTIFESEEILLEEGIDPGMLSTKDVEELRRNIYD